MPRNLNNLCDYAGSYHHIPTTLLMEEAKEWVKEYEKNDGNAEAKRVREPIIAWIKYFFGV